MVLHPGDSRCLRVIPVVMLTLTLLLGFSAYHTLILLLGSSGSGCRDRGIKEWALMWKCITPITDFPPDFGSPIDGKVPVLLPWGRRAVASLEENSAYVWEQFLRTKLYATSL